MSHDIVKQMIKMDNFPEMGGYIREQGLLYIGSGSSRDVFALNDKEVIKVARNNKGISQNYNEIFISQNYDYHPLIAKVLGADIGKSRFVISERVVDNFTDKEMMMESFYRHFGIPPSKFDLAIELMTQDNEEVKKYFPCGFEGNMKLLRDMFVAFGLMSGDLMMAESWGMIGSKMCIKDYGLTFDTYNEHYKKRRK